MKQLIALVLILLVGCVTVSQPTQQPGTLTTQQCKAGAQQWAQQLLKQADAQCAAKLKAIAKSVDTTAEEVEVGELEKKNNAKGGSKPAAGTP